MSSTCEVELEANRVAGCSIWRWRWNGKRFVKHQAIEASMDLPVETPVAKAMAHSWPGSRCAHPRISRDPRDAAPVKLARIQRQACILELAQMWSVPP